MTLWWLTWDEQHRGAGPKRIIDLPLSALRLVRRRGAVDFPISTAPSRQAGVVALEQIRLSLDATGPRRPAESRSVSDGCPAAIGMRDRQYSARVLNLAQGGALIETFAPLLARSALKLRCGTCIVATTVVWRISDRLGINFDAPLTEAQVVEQV